MSVPIPWNKFEVRWMTFKVFSIFFGSERRNHITPIQQHVLRWGEDMVPVSKLCASLKDNDIEGAK